MVAPVKALIELLTVDNILLDLDLSDKEQVFEAVGQLLGNRPGLAVLPLAASLLAREELGSTALGLGLAVPHARIKGLAYALAVFIRPRAPIPFDAPDGKPVSDIVAIFVPEQATQAHLQLLAGVAELFQNQRFREKLKLCADATSVYRLLAAWAES
jgi:PTS system nitrogen regulatory IIA component